MCLMALSNAFGAVTWYLNEDFESGQIPTGWTQEVVSSNVANWLIEPTTSATYPASGNESNYYVALRNTTGIDQHYVVKLITPAIDFVSAVDLTQPQLVFKHAQVGAGTFFDTLKVYSRANASAPWVLMRTFDSRVDQWTEDTIALTGFSGSSTYQIGFEAVENMGRGIVLDDVRVMNASTCITPSNVAMRIPGTTSVTLAWAGGLETDTFEVVVSATEITDWSSYSAVYHGFSADFSVLVTGLNPQTNYFAYVRAKCADNESGWTPWANGTFRTRARVDMPYFEDFSSSLPEGWVTQSTISGKPSFSSATATASTLAGYSVDSTFAMQFGSITAGKYACAITPEVNVPSLQNVEVGFWGYAATNIRTPLNSNIAQMYVGVMQDPEDSASLVIIDSVEIKVASKHQHFTVSFMGYNGTGKYIAFIVSNPKRAGYFYIDHLTITQPAVLTPTDVKITNATPDGFDVQVNLHGADKWNLRVADAASYNHMNVLPSSFLVSQDGITGNTYHVSGNFGETVVSVYAQGVSGQNTSAWSFPTTLRIPARATLPLAYEFDATGDASVLVKSLDNEIHITNSNKTFPGLYFPLLDLTNFYPKLTTGTPKYENTSHMLLQGLNQWVALPYVDSFEGQMVSFRLAAATAGQSRVAVGIMRDAYDFSTFTKLAEFDGPLNSYTKCEVDLDGLDSLGHYVAIVAIKPKAMGTNGSINHIDALHIEAIPACPEALDIKAVVADTAINLSWPSRGMNHWLVEVFAGANEDSLLISKDVNTPEATIGGLTSLTEYYYRVSTRCGNDTVHGNGKIHFMTKCDLITSFPWSEDFESFQSGTSAGSSGVSLNANCWDNEHISGSGSYLFQVVKPSSGMSGNTSRMLVLPDQTAGTITRLTLPEVILPSADYEFVLTVLRNSSYNTKTTEGVRIFASDGVNEAELAFIPRLAAVSSSTIGAESTDGWYTYELPIGFSGPCRIIIQGENQYGAPTYMDNFVVRQTPACQKVKLLTVSNITASGATVSWTPRGNENQWQYVVTIPGHELDWANASLTGTPSVSLTGLNGSSSYTIYVRAYCGANEQSEMVSKSFNTACGPIMSMPWSESFEAYPTGTYNDMSLPCWSTLNVAATSSSTYPQAYVYNTATYVKTGSKSLYMKASNAKYMYILLPAIGLPLNTLKLTFSHREASATASGILSVGYLTDPTDASSFVTLSEFTRVAGWQDEELILTSIPADVANTARLAFRLGGGTGNGSISGLDDVMLEAVDFSCPGLNDMTATTNSTSSITIAWTAESMVPVNIEVSDSANFSVVRSFPGVETSPFVLDSLEENHRYYVRARQACDSEGEWKSAVVKTLCSPVVPGEYPVQRFQNADDLDCWMVGVSIPGKVATDNPSIGNLAARGKYLYFNKAATTNDTVTRGDGLYAIMPMMDVDSIKHYEVGFKAFKTSTSAGNAGRLTVGVLTDPSDFSTFTAIQTMKLDYAADSLWEKEYTVNFLSYTGDYNDDYGKYIVFYAQSGDSLNQIGVDNVEVRTVAGCPQIGEGVITDTVSNGATYHWVGTGAPAYEVVVLTERMSPDSAYNEIAFRDTVSTDSVVIRGISPSRMYYAFVRGLCDDNVASRWSTYTRFRTPCGIATVPYAEKFDDTEALKCFNVGNMQSTSTTYIPTLQTGTTYLYNSQQSLKLYAYTYSTTTKADSAYVILPEMNYGTKGLQGQTLSFYGRSYSSTSTTTDYNKKLKVGVVSGEDMRTFQLVKEVSMTDSYALQEVSFEEYTGSGNRIALLAAVNQAATTTTKYCYAYLDDISVFQTPTCKSIASLKAKVSRRTIDVTIVPKDNGTPDHYDLVYSPTALSLAQLEAAAKISVDTTGLYTIRGLDRETQYYIYARANCGAEDGVSDWSSVSVATKGLYGCDDNQGVGLDATTTNASLPMSSNFNYGVYEQIYTAAEIGRAGRIGTLSFFNTGTTKSRRFEMYMLHTTKSEFSSTTDWVAVTAADKVFDGEIEFVTGEWNSITLDKVFEYDGTQNLLLVVHNYTGSYSSGMSCKTFPGTNQALYKQQDTGDLNPFNMTETGSRLSVKNQLLVGFCYDVAPCPTISDLSTELLGAGISEAMLRWTASEGDYLSGYDVIVSDTVVAQPDSITPTYANVQGDSLHVTGLSPETLYYVYVRAICKAEGHDEGVSTWVDTTFETLANCPAVVNLASEQTAATTVKVTWERALEEQALNFAYVCSTDSLGKAELAVAEKTYVNDTLAVEISNLAYGQKYYIYVASVCGHSFSPWSQTVITTDAACAPVRNLEIARLEHNRVVLQWNRSRFGSETQWEAGIMGDSASIVYVSDTSDIISAMIIGLTPETQYTAYVRTICDEGQVSEIVTLPFTTKAWFGSCINIGEGTTSGYYVPFANFYKNAWTQSIYTADQIGSAGLIGSIQYQVAAAPASPFHQAITIYLAHTTMDLASTTSSWVPQGDLVEVYSNADFVHPMETEWMEIKLTNPFDYNGTDNLAVVVSTYCTSYASALKFTYTAGTSGVSLYRGSDTYEAYREYPGTSTGTKSTNLPNVQFCFAQAVNCLPVDALTVHDVTTTTAVASWEPMGSERSWEVYVADTTIFDFTGLRFDTAYNYVYPIAGLQEDKNYWFYVRPLCGGEWSTAEFTTVANCPAPISLNVDSLTDTAAKLVWTRQLEVGNSYQVAYGLADTFNLADPNTYTLKGATMDYVVLDGLTAQTEYSAAVRSLCDANEQSRWSEIITFKTPCSITPLPWREGFEDYPIGTYNSPMIDCWDALNINDGTSTTYPQAFVNNSTAYVRTGSQSLYFKSSNSRYAYVIMPLFEAPLNRLQISFSYKDESATSSGYLELGYMTNVDNDSSFVLLAQYPRSTAWQDILEQPLDSIPAEVAATARLAFRYGGGSSNNYYLGIDDILVEVVPTCPGPLSVTVLENAADSATFTWVPKGRETQWQYVCVPEGTTPDWSTAVLTSDTTVTIHGLTSGASNYTFYVRSYCSADDQSEARSTIVHTDCGVITLDPWTEGFETMEVGSYSNPSLDCWSFINASSASTTTYPQIFISNAAAYVKTGSQSLYFKSSNTDSCYAILPKFAAPLNTLEISFWHKEENAGSSGYLDLGYMVDDTVFVSIAQFERSTAWQKERVMLNVGNRIPDSLATITRLAFCYGGGPSNNYYMGIDDIKVQTIDANCAGIADARVTETALSSATIEWIYAGGSTDAEIQVATDTRFMNLVDTTIVRDDSLYVVTGLQSSTTYYARIRQACGDGEFSDWTETISFRTSYGLPFVPSFTSTTVPTDWTRSNTKAAQVFTDNRMNPYSGGWTIVAADTVFDAYHIRGNITGTTWNYWLVTPSIDLTPNVGQGIILSLDAAMVATSANAEKMYTGSDDRFLVAVSTDGGATWDPANVTEWNNSGTGDYVYNDVPTSPRTYYINMSDYAGNVVKIGFYGESSVTNAVNYFHIGNVSLETVETTNYLDTLCEGNSFNKNGFNIPFEQLPAGMHSFSRYEVNTDGTLSLYIQQILVSAASFVEIPVELCEGEHYNGYGFDVTVTQSESIRKRIDGGNQFGCDSTAILQITMLPTIRTELIVGCNEESYTWHGKTYYQSTIVDDTTSSVVTGCDSITTLHLTFCAGEHYRYHNAFCQGGSYSDEFFENLTAPGEYKGSRTDMIGCVTNAELTLHQLAPGQNYVDSVHVSKLPYVLGNDTLCPETDQPGYVYHGSADFGCGLVNVTIYVYDKVALDNIAAGTLQVAPNPVRIGEDIRILTSIGFTSDYSCRVFDAVGKLVYESFEPATTIPGLPVAGAYTIRISAGNTIYQGKLIVK